MAEGGNVFISTGLVDNVPCPLLGREPVRCGALCAGVPVEGWSAGDEAIARSGNYVVNGDRGD